MIFFPGSAGIDSGHEDNKKVLYEEANKIVDRGWKPAFVMIDKSLANKVAVNRGALQLSLSGWTDIESFNLVLPGVPVRICQFHVIQVCLVLSAFMY